MNTKKRTRIFSILVTMAILIGMLPMTVSATTEIASGESYEVTWSLDSGGVFTVSGDGWMWDYESEDEVPWKDYRDMITSVVFGEGVTHISYYGFYGCKNLTSVTFENDRLYRIGEYAFYNCENLKTISIPEGTRVIGYNAFGCDDAGKGLDSVYIYAKNAELSFYYDEDNTFPKHTLVYGYECSRTEAHYWCEKYGRTFVPLDGGCVVEVEKGEDCIYDFNNDSDVADLWKASKAENGSDDSLMLDYTFTLDAEEIIEPHNYMVDSQNEMLIKDGSNDGRVEVEIALDLGDQTIYKTFTYSYCPTDLDGAINNDYNVWSTYAEEKPFINMNSDGAVVNIEVKGTLKDACETYEIENPDYVSLHVRVTGVTSYKRYSYGKYYTTDNDTQMEFHYMSLYDAHSRDMWIEDIGPRPLDRVIYVTDNAPDTEKYYEPVKREYIWEYDFTRICSEYDWENMEQAPGDGGWDSDVFLEEYEGVLYGHARGIYNAGSDNSMRLSDFITNENREFIHSLVGINSWDIQIMANCTVILTYADGSTVELFDQAVREGTYIVAPCMHACTVCGLCTITEKMLSCNFDTNMWMHINCQCEEPITENVETEVIEEVLVDTENSMVYIEPTVVVEKIDIAQAANTKYAQHITKGFVSDKAVMVFNVDLFDGDTPYQLNQWGGEDEFLTITVPVGTKNAQLIKNGEILVYHIEKNGNPELVEINPENDVDEENGTITFSSTSFSPFVLVEASEETTAKAIFNEADNTCTAQITLTTEDFRKDPVIYVAFYNSKGALVEVKQKNATTLADKYTLDIPKDSATCKVMLWTSQLTPICAAGMGGADI